jgi:hypothetical protein
MAAMANAMAALQIVLNNYNICFCFCATIAGTDVMIFKILSPKKLAKKLTFFAQTTSSFCKNCDQNIGF